MIQFQELTLSGFKSFVEKTQLDIAPGLTGIVGPNGCGKSNLVEALRWVMGENSAKRMRGGDMDDVIFNGTENRPARNFAEVNLTIDNRAHTAPVPYAGFDTLEISRRIERDQGSTYRINGKIARARDVQMLLADTMTGASSPALVSQGKLTQIITAKPFDRRLILEESAGITGLHARRHEAELKLQAAEANLVRLQDTVGTLESQLGTLKRQARQAEKYRVLTDEIKKLELWLAAVEWMKLNIQHQTTQHDITQIETAVAEALLQVTRTTQAMEMCAADLPALRQTAAESAARAQAVAIERRALDQAEAQMNETLMDARAQLDQIARDLQMDAQTLADCRQGLETLVGEEQQLQADIAADETRGPILQATHTEAQARVQSIESELQAKNQILIETQTKRQALLSQRGSEQTRQDQQHQKLSDTRARLERFMAERTATGTDDVALKIDDLAARLDTLQTTQAAAQENLARAEETVTTRRAEAAKAREALARLQAEQKTLIDFLSTDLGPATTPIVQNIQTEHGFEQALAQALGETLFGSTDENATVVWRGRTSLPAPAFPVGVAPLDEKIKAPPALQAALSFIGYVLDREAGDGAAPFLAPGQIIVSMDGYLWRWDGLFVKPSAKDRQALILEQRNRLSALNDELPFTTTTAERAAENLTAAEEALAQAKAAMAATEGEMKSTQSALNAARASYQKILQEQQHYTAETARLAELIDHIQAECAERALVIETLDKALTDLPDPAGTDLAASVALLRDQYQDAQAQARAAALDLDRFDHERARRQARYHGIGDERVALQNRLARTEQTQAERTVRQQTLQAKIDDLAGKPEELAAMRQDLLSRESRLDHDKAQAADTLATAEQAWAQAQRAQKDAEQTLAQVRETRAGLHARLTALTEHTSMMEQELAGTFNLSPADIMTAAGVSFDLVDACLSDIEPNRARKDKCVRDRDAIGPVNLRAEVEASDIDAQLQKILTERVDLQGAIDELRAGVTTINREAKERLQQAFTTIDGHFKTLFTTLFGGGQAHLQLIESDDPLQAGLEIFAQPPGKTLQSISLLSGGEQSLTAAALIFAMFMTNPSPICVLDEIDAPLDDANVDRICHLLRDICNRCQTRFLVVTHHRLTMARMDRLFGVTMGEKGVSQLVSVDLQQQLDLLEAA